MKKNDECVRMDELTAGLSTKADKMRVLERNGYARADIARFLGVRYQQVRNTLEGDKRTGYNPQIAANQPSQTSATDELSAFRRLKIAKDGFACIPLDLLEPFGGDEAELYALPVEGGIFISSINGMASRVEKSFA